MITNKMFCCLRLTSRMSSFIVFVALFNLLTIGSDSAFATYYYIDKNHPSASDSNSGTEASPWLNPWAIVSKTFSPGDTVYLKAGTYPMTAQAWTNYNCPTAHFRQSGTSGSPITLKNYSTDSVIFDVGQGTGETPALGVCTSYSVNWIVLDGIKLINIGRRGISVYNASDIVIKNMEITQLPNSCAACVCDNNPMLRIEGSTRVKVQNNYFHDHVSSCNDGNTNAIQVYDSTFNLYENNDIRNVAAGITHKGVTTSNHDHTVRYNYIANTSIEGIRFSGADGFTLNRNKIHNNICVNVNYCGEFKNSNSVGNYQIDLEVYNNTVYGYTSQCFQSPRDGSTGFKFYNNLCYDPDGSHSNDFGTKDTNSSSLASTITSTSNYNLFNSTSLKLQCGEGGTSLTTLSAWQSGCHNFDATSITATPLFVNPSTGPSGFKLQAGSPGRNAGRVGGVSSGSIVNIGAYALDTEVIGLSTSLSTATDAAPPVPPTGLVIY